MIFSNVDELVDDYIDDTNMLIDYDDEGYRFYKNLNEDVRLKPDSMGRWDIDFDYEHDDWVNVTGFDSVYNACVLAIMTRFTELDFMSLYSDYGCRVHELIKANKNANLIYQLEIFITEVLNSIRRIKTVHWVNVTNPLDNDTYEYHVNFSVSCMSDEYYEGLEEYGVLNYESNTFEGELYF